MILKQWMKIIINNYSKFNNINKYNLITKIKIFSTLSINFTIYMINYKIIYFKNLFILLIKKSILIINNKYVMK